MMRSFRCIRLARQSTRALQRSSQTLESFPSQYRGFHVRSQHLAAAGSNRFAGDHEAAQQPAARNKAAKDGSAVTAEPQNRADEDEQHMSSFRQQRIKDFEAAQEGEDPLWPETYPRLGPDPMRLSVKDFKAKFGNHGNDLRERATLHGRIRAKRVLGKNLVFLDIVDNFIKIQVTVTSKEVMPEHLGNLKFSLWRNLVQVGDHIEVTGLTTFQKNGELALRAEELPQLVSPTKEQIPEKIVDPKTKNKNRSLDMLVNQQTTDILRLRSAITKYLRDHFHTNDFIEVQTPIMSEHAGGAIARPFKTQATEFRDKELALRIAPELYLKRLVVGGMEKVFEIGQSFRNEGIDGTHNPEFTTCEFYSAYSNLDDLMTMTEELIQGLATECQSLIETQLTALPALEIHRFSGPFTKIEMIPALEQALNIRFPNLSSATAHIELLTILKLAGITLPGGYPRQLPKLLDELSSIYLEPRSKTHPIFITNHPACMSPLAKSFLCPKTYQMVSARAELFVGGRELANMYEEENDPDAQERKMNIHKSLVNKPDGTVGLPEGAAEKLSEEDDAARALLEAEETEVEARDDDDETPPIDRAFIQALQYGLPPTGGWGCGVERLVMLFAGTERIGDCLTFGTLRHVVYQDKKKQ